MKKKSKKNSENDGSNVCVGIVNLPRSKYISTVNKHSDSYQCQTRPLSMEKWSSVTFQGLVSLD